MHSRIVFRFLFCITLSVISIASLVPHFFPQNFRINHDFTFRLDYVLHFISYFFLAAFFSIWKFSKDKKYRLILFFTIFGIILSSIFEIIQYFLQSRTFNPYDMLCNFSGFVIGLVLIIILQKLKRITTREARY